MNRHVWFSITALMTLIFLLAACVAGPPPVASVPETPEEAEAQAPEEEEGEEE